MHNIPLSKEQYLALLKAVDACEMMQSAIAEADEIEEKDEDKTYEKLNEYLLGHAATFGLEKADLSKVEDDWVNDLSDTAADLINDYAEVEMFDNLAWDLASMEFEKRKGNDTFTDIEEYTKRGEIYDSIMDEFDEHDLDNVKIKGIIE